MHTQKVIKLTPPATKWLLLVNGIVNLAIGIVQLNNNIPFSTWIYILGITLVITSPMLMGYSIILFSNSNKFNPRVHVHTRGITIKSETFGKPVTINWDELKEIVFKSFEIEFLLKGHRKISVVLDTSAFISQEIKQTVRLQAENMGVRISGN